MPLEQTASDFINMPGYTIQISATSNLQNLKNTQKLLPMKSHIYKVKHKKYTNWFILVSGNYLTKQLASKQILAIKHNTIFKNAWTKPILDIRLNQQQIIS